MINSHFLLSNSMIRLIRRFRTAIQRCAQHEKLPLKAFLQASHLFHECRPAPAGNLDAYTIIHNEVSAVSLYEHSHEIEVDHVAFVDAVKVKRG